MHVTVKYNDEKATCTLRDSGARRVVLDEFDCDALLRVREHAVDPAADITEFFCDVHLLSESVARRFALAFIEHDREIARHVYA